jgi:hypothetical protein
MKLTAAAFLFLASSAYAQVPPNPVAPPTAPAPATNCSVASANRSTILRSAPAGTLAPGTLSTIAFWTDFTVTCKAIKAPQSFQVPASIDGGSLGVELYGAAGSRAGWGPKGGPGAYVRTTLNVSPGTMLQVFVGGTAVGTNPLPTAVEDNVGGWNGGGIGGYFPGWAREGGSGGGATDIRIAPFGLENRLAVAGGGGGGGSSEALTPSADGGAGGRNGGDGKPGLTHFESGDRDNYHSGGYGATQTAPGAGGLVDRWYNDSHPGNPGVLGVGGTPHPGIRSRGGGGGGGVFGGGSGNDTGGGAGGGGSSIGAANDAGAQIVDGQNQGEGKAVLRYRVYTKRVQCFEGSLKAIVRGKVYANPSCEAFAPST